MLKAIIVDDEQHCIDRIDTLLQPYANLMVLLGSYNTVADAIRCIHEEQPDVVFLDVHLHNETGFDLLHQLEKISFEIVFTTAYDTYAVEAFRFSALDYLIKPIDPADFAGTMERITLKSGQRDMAKKIEVLFHNFEHKLNKAKKIAIPTLEGLTLLHVHEIIRCQSDGNYTNVYLNTAKKITATKTLKYFEDLLDGDNFFRIHKSHYININYVDKYLKGKGGYVQMTDGAPIEVAVRRKEEFLRKLRD